MSNGECQMTKWDCFGIGHPSFAICHLPFVI